MFFFTLYVLTANPGNIIELFAITFIYPYTIQQILIK